MPVKYSRSSLLLTVLLLGVLTAFARLVWFALAPVELAASPADFSIRPGSSLRSATNQMIDAGIAMRALEFNSLARLMGSDTGIKAGSYEVETGVTPWELLRKITLGDFSQSEIVFLEGWTFRQVRAALDRHPDVRHETDGLSDEGIMRRLGEPGVAAEGMFFPDTYLFAKGQRDVSILLRAHRAMQKRLQSAWEQRAPNVPVATPYEALVLASIVEKETGQSADRARIAGVLANRLRAGMLLQTDPAVIYGLGEKFDGNLRRKHLVKDTPFNTYTRPGLPPTPISIPGQESLLAALNPARTDALYFVARRDGSSEFSRTLEEHNRAVAKYQKARAR